MIARSPESLFFFFNDTATTEIYTLSLHDALPISTSPPPTFSTSSRPPRLLLRRRRAKAPVPAPQVSLSLIVSETDRKSTRLNSSHSQISYAVFCLNKNTLVTRSPSLDSCTSIALP